MSMIEEIVNNTIITCHGIGLTCLTCYRYGKECDGDDTDILDIELEELDLRRDQ